MPITFMESVESKYAKTYATEVIVSPGKRPGNFSLYGEQKSDSIAKYGRVVYGLPLPLEFFPEQIRFTKGKRVFDYNAYTKGGLSVSQRFKDAVEAIEPGVHQFVPFELFHKDGSPYPEPLWFFTVIGEVDAVNPETGGVQKQIVSIDGEYQWKVVDRQKLAVYKSAIEGRAAWYDRHYSLYPFMSDALVERLNAEKMEGWDTKDFWQAT